MQNRIKQAPAGESEAKGKAVALQLSMVCGVWKPAAE